MYIIAVLLTVSMVNTWKNTTLKMHVLDLFIKTDAYKEITSVKEWNDYMLMFCGWWGELMVCHICLSHWVGLASGIGIALVAGGLCWWFPLLVMFTAPLFVSKFVD